MKHSELKLGMKVSWKKYDTWGSYDAEIVRIGQTRVTILVTGWMGDPRDPRKVTVTARSLSCRVRNKISRKLKNVDNYATY